MWRQRPGTVPVPANQQQYGRYCVIHKPMIAAVATPGVRVRR